MSLLIIYGTFLCLVPEASSLLKSDIICDPVAVPNQAFSLEFPTIATTTPAPPGAVVVGVLV